MAVDKVAYASFTIPAKETNEKTENKSETVETVQVFSKANERNLKSLSPLRARDLIGMSLNPEMRSAYLQLLNGKLVKVENNLFDLKG